MKHIGSVAKALVQDPMGPGFESQVPQKLCIIFLQVFRRASAIMVHHTPSNLKAPDGPRPDLVVQR